MELKIGSNYYVHTVTDDWVGELVSVDGPYTITLKKVSWISETGRLNEFMQNGIAYNENGTPSSEIEVFPPDLLCMRHWIGIDEWKHPLFKETV